MNFGKAWGIFIASLSTCIICSHTANADFYLHPWMDQHTPKGIVRVAPEVGYYSTTANFNDSGTETTPISLKSFSRINLDALGAAGMSDSLTIYGRLEWSAISMSTTTKDSTGYGLADQSVGANWHLLGSTVSSVSFDLQIQGDVPAYSQPALSDQTPALGDQSIAVISGGFLKFSMWKGPRAALDLTAGAGFAWRASGYSPAVPWSVFANYSTAKTGVLFSGGVYGIYSMGNDTHTRTGSPGALTGGSFMSEALKPSLTVASAKLGYRFNPQLDIALLGAMPVIGKSAPKGSYAALTAEFRFGAGVDSDENVDPLMQHPEQYRKSNKGFVSYTFEAKITSTNDRLSLVKMNKGNESGVEEGQIYDLFKPNADGSAGNAVARAVVKSVKSGEAVLSIKEYFREVWIEEGFIVKRPLQ